MAELLRIYSDGIYELLRDRSCFAPRSSCWEQWKIANGRFISSNVCCDVVHHASIEPRWQRQRHVGVNPGSYVTHRVVSVSPRPHPPELLTAVKRKRCRPKEMPFYHPIVPSDLHGKTLVVVSVITSLAFKQSVACSHRSQDSRSCPPQMSRSWPLTC